MGGTSRVLVDRIVEVKFWDIASMVRDIKIYPKYLLIV